MWDYGFGALENQLIEAGKEYPPNYEKMKALLAAGADINAASLNEEPDESILSMIILGYPESFDKDCDGKYLPDLCRFFLQNGFDVHGNKDTVGGRCLMNLTWSSYDRYILDAAKVLICAGANADYKSDDESLLEWVSIKASAAGVIHEDPELEILFAAFYDLLKTASEHRDFSAIG